MYQPHHDGIHSDPATNMEIRVKGRENGCILTRLHPEVCPFFSRTLHTTAVDTATASSKGTNPHFYSRKFVQNSIKCFFSPKIIKAIMI